MNVSIKVVLIAVGIIAGVAGLTIGIVSQKFTSQAPGVLSPFLVISIALLIGAAGYTASVFRGKRR